MGDRADPDQEIVGLGAAELVDQAFFRASR